MTMRAIVIKQYGGPDVLELQNVQDPNPVPGQVLVRVEAFGLNRAETYMRRGEWGDVARIPGIECVGVVEHDTTGQLVAGTKVACVMGGLGRSLNGSYAELTCVPAANVVAITTSLPWAHFAAIPESYATAWSCLDGNLALSRGQVVLIRGGGSALGRAAIDIASERGATVIATARTAASAARLSTCGASRTIVESASLAASIRSDHPRGVDAVLDLIGNSTLLDSLGCVRRGGRVCVAGFLGGLAPIAAFNPLAQMPSDVHLSFFASFMFGSHDFPLSAVPLQEIVDKAARERYRAQPSRVFRLEDIREAHRWMDEQQAGGKLVVVVR
jgi:NADPH2:quinone reductase